MLNEYNQTQRDGEEPSTKCSERALPITKPTSAPVPTHQQDAVNQVNQPRLRDVFFISEKCLTYNIPNDHRDYLTVMVNNYSHTVLLDGGAEVTVISQTFYEKCIWGQLQPTKTSIGLADNSISFKAIGKVDVLYTVGSLTRLVPTLVVPISLKHPIMGRAFLGAFYFELVQNQEKVQRFLKHTAKGDTEDVASAKVEMVTADKFINFCNQPPGSGEEQAQVSSMSNDLEPIDASTLGLEGEQDTPKITSVSLPHSLPRSKTNVGRRSQTF
ncbi:PREDICTED: uncharacterized protein LOC108360171 [Rhagoletis zephyria]|uniref:uncharacterized protein LOC108360171 n=1 Tax=Rhagoletis zephyria TaxID=28612 RepID=UPI000811443C|nr:PREDICTED: uncharacterized protein LOC108360171 [Rhagoletis zephyria]